MDPIIGRFIGEVKKTLAETAEDSMLYPKGDSFEHGVQVGKYQGLKFSLDILESILRDINDEEKRS